MKEDVSLFFDKIGYEQKRVRQLKIENIAAYAVERRRRRKARKRRFPNKARAYMVIAANDPCAYCGEIIEYKYMTIDHIVPRAHGGTNDWDNLTPCCTTCNVKKDSLSLLVFLAKEHSSGRR